MLSSLSINILLHTFVIINNLISNNMEKYKKVCKDVKPVGDPDQYGNQAFVITFSDDSSGFFRCKEQDLFQVGVESDFYMGKETGRTGKEYSKIQRVSAVEKDWDNTEKKS